MHNKFFGVVAIFLIQWQTNAQTLTKTQLATAPEPSVYSNIEWIDLDADGDMDFIALFSDPNDDANSFVKVYQNANGAYTEQPGAFGSSSMDPRSYAFNDGDGDGDIDLLFLDNEGVKIAANNGDFTFVIQYTTVSNPSNLRVEIHWQDLDGDLDLDIVFDTFTYMNIEGVHHPALHNMPPYTRNRSWADVDNDGYLDMVATKGQSQGVNPLFLFLNQGDGLFKEKEKLSPGFLDGGQTQWLDADADHDLDLFITEEGEKSTLLENVFIESGTVGFQEVVSFKTLSNTKADVGDLNLDGLPDIIITGQGFPRFETYLYRNTSTAGEINFAESNLQINPYLVSNFKLVDIDSDSDLDLFILGWDDDAYSIRAQNVYNVIPGSSRPVPAVPANLASAVGEVVTLSWEDSNEGTVFFDLSITLDGVPFNPGLATSSGWFLMPDILALQNTSNVTLQNLPPGSYQWKVQAFDHAYRASGFSGSSAFTVIEAPGSLSLVMQAYNRVDIAWQYSGTATEFSVQRRSTNSALSEIGRVAGNTMTFTDAAVPPNEHVEYVIKAIKNGSYSAPSHSVAFYSAQFDEIPFNPAGPNIIAASGISADLDQDQDFDLAFVGRVDDEYSTSISLRNNGAGVYSEAAFLPGAEELGEPIVSRDLDNDGDIDIVAVVGTAGAGFKVAVYKNNGTAVFTKSFETVAYPGISQVVSEDMNQDGLPDLMINRTLGNNAANPPTYELLYQTAAGSFVDSKVNFLTDDTSTIGLGDFHLADMNNDGFTDVVFSGGYNVNAKLFLNLKGDAFREESFGLTSLTDPAFFDFNGDGVLDVLQRGFQVLYLHNGLGGAQFGDAQEISIAGIGANEEIQVNIADVDFNGWPDLIVNDSYNTTLLHNTGQGNFVRGDYQFASGWAARVFLTDMDGDGDIDLIKLGNDNYHQGQCFYYNNRSISLPGQNGAPTTIAGLQVSHLANSTTLSWAPSTDDSTPSALISYHVKVIDGNGKHWVHPETNATGTFRRRLDYGNAGFRTSFTINDLPAGNYTAHIQAVDATFKLSGASTINFQITAGPNSLSVERILLNKVKLVWTDGPLNGSATVVARKSKHSDFQVIAELSGNATTFTDEGLEYDDVYTYHVYEKSAAITTAPSNSVTWNTTLLVLEQSTITNATGSLDVGDYTNDGKMDMLIFGGRIFNGIEVGLTNALLEKVPTGWTQHAAGAPTIPDAGTSVFYDINGDHLIDLYQHGFIYSASKYETNVLLNNGNKTFSSATNIFTADDVGILEAWDYDRDNDLDFYVTQPGQPNSLIKNNGEGAFVADTKQSACCDRSIVPGDYDNDGDEDIVHFDRTSNNFTLLLNTEKSLVPNTNFPVSGGRMQKLDYNGDGFPDLLFLADNAYDAKSKLFKNQGPDAEGEIQFKLIRDNFPTGDVTVNTADYDHDGDLDIFFTGTPCVMYNNLGDDDFKETKLLNFSAGANNTKWVDFDGDGDLDLFMTGYFKVNHADNVDHPFAFILNNQLIVSGTGVENLPPAAPVNLTSSQDTEGLHLSWTGQPDDHTAIEALTHDVVLYKDGNELMKVPANPTSGARLKLQDGRAAGRLTIDNLAYGDYTWKVQAIDQTFLGSPLSLQGQFTFIPQAPMMNDTVIYQCDREISLVAPGTNIEWYSDQALTDKIGEGAYSPEASQTVYVTQTVAGRRGVARAVKITIEARPPMPIASVDPYFYCENNAGGPANLAVAGTDIKWYKDAGGNVSAGSGNQLSIVLSEQILYATQTISQCESLPATIMVKPVVITSDVHFGDGEIYTDEQDADFYQWYKNNSPLADANDYLLDDIEDGATYKVYIEKGACSETSTPTVITGIEDRVDSHLKIFPNPASGSFTIEMDKPGGVITIYDVAGRIVFEAFGNTSRQIISSSSWSRGLYYVTIHFGQTIVCKKVVIN